MSELLSGWGRTAPTSARVVSTVAEHVPDVLAAAGPRGIIARGLGRSYGDPAQNAGGDVLLRLPSAIDLDGETVRVSAGTSLHELMSTLLPRGRFLPAVPGTRWVTVGGAIACDVHGKGHHVTGTFGANLVSFELVTPDGTSRVVTPDGSPELFWGTVGGMGLTGVITSAVLRTTAVETGWVSATTERFLELDQVMAAMREADHRWAYSVAWLDTLSRGRHLGRSVLSRGEPASADQVSAAGRERFPLPREPRLGAPPWVPNGLVSRPTVRAFNEAWFRRAPRFREGELQTVASFFNPLDGIAGWNRLYGRSGFVQYQFVVPDAADEVVHRVVDRLAHGDQASFLAVLKRFGPANPGLLSFPMGGWTLALDLPATPGLAPFLDALDDLVLEAGGRVYLAKDSRLRADRFAAMYPRLDEFRALRARLDPGRILASDLARRLDL